METYFVQGNEHEYFVKLGANVERYHALAEIGLTPPVLSVGQLESGLSIFVQPFIDGRMLSRADFQNQLESVAALIHIMHADPHVKGALQPTILSLHGDVGLQAWDRLLQKWARYKAQVPDVAWFVEKSLQDLALQIHQFTTKGLAACHNDICNANWLFSADGVIYIVDLESMSLDDPALDLGALLWWYYPPELRQKFLDHAGYSNDQEFRFRMHVRMALHCLSITLPREQSFDVFHPDRFVEALTDFKAVLDGKENPQGYT